MEPELSHSAALFLLLSSSFPRLSSSHPTLTLFSRFPCSASCALCDRTVLPSSGPPHSDSKQHRRRAFPPSLLPHFPLILFCSHNRLRTPSSTPPVTPSSSNCLSFLFLFSSRRVFLPFLPNSSSSASSTRPSPTSLAKPISSKSTPTSLSLRRFPTRSLLRFSKVRSLSSPASHPFLRLTPLPLDTANRKELVTDFLRKAKQLEFLIEALPSLASGEGDAASGTKEDEREFEELEREMKVVNEEYEEALGEAGAFSSSLSSPFLPSPSCSFPAPKLPQQVRLTLNCLQSLSTDSSKPAYEAFSRQGATPSPPSPNPPSPPSIPPSHLYARPLQYLCTHRHLFFHRRSYHRCTHTPFSVFSSK
jgi:hypothetical protein